MSVEDRLFEKRIVPVIVLHDAAMATDLADALVAGGLPIAEVTFRTGSAPDILGVIAARGDVLAGAGTVVSAKQVDQAVDAGAQFIVSPGLDAQVAARCADLDVFYLPGAVTATEVMAAMRLGAHAVKFFPAGTSGGAKAIKALAAPFPGMRFVPTGGIGPWSIADYLSIPAVAAVGGSWMVPSDLMRAQRFQGIEALVEEAVKLAAESSPATPSESK